MSAITLTINGKRRTVDVPPDTKLLWVLRDSLGLTGTKYSCGMSICGACTVHVEGQPVRSCSKTITSVVGKSITTIEGLATDILHPLQKAWVDTEVSQCGYCQPGQIMTAAALLEKDSNPSDAVIDKEMSRNLCRCGTYNRIRHAIHQVAEGV